MITTCVVLVALGPMLTAVAGQHLATRSCTTWSHERHTAFSPSVAALDERRRLLRAFVGHMGWRWEDLSAGQRAEPRDQCPATTYW